MKALHLAVVLASLMAAAAVAGIALRPSQKAADATPRYVLETLVPKQFGAWRALPTQGAGVVNPQTQKLLDSLYSQTLSRTYVDASGYRIMLSLAYGHDQRGSLQAHMPEVCYPAQGFALHSNAPARLATPFGPIEARQLSTSLGLRKEPVTYWFTMGGTSVRSKFQQRLLEIRLGLTGQVPDGLLFRVSSIDPDPAHAFAQHQAFANALLRAVPSQDRVRLSGLADGVTR